MIGPLILLLSVSYGAFLCHRYLSSQFSDARISLVTAAGIWFLSVIYSSTELPLNQMVADISLMVTYSVILMALLMMIREMKPSVFRYPYVAVFMPLIIPVSYYLVYQASLMKGAIIYSVSGMIVMVSLFLSVSYSSNKKLMILNIAGAVLLAVSISISALIDEDQYIYRYWYLVTSIGLAVTAYGFVFTFNKK